MTAHSAIDWGNVTELLGAVAVLITVVVTVLITRSERQRSDRLVAEERSLTREALQQAADSHALEVQRWTVELAEREQWQSRLVACAVELRTMFQGRPVIRIGVHNSSAVPVFDVRPFVLFQGVPVRAEHVPDSRPIGAGSIDEIDFGLPGESVLNAPPHTCGVTFRDCSGLYWAKYLSGHLVRLEGDHERMLAVSPL